VLHFSFVSRTSLKRRKLFLFQNLLILIIKKKRMMTWFIAKK